MFVVGSQAYCTAPSGKNEPSLGRRRREVDSDSAATDGDMKADNSTEEEEQVREMIEVRFPSSCLILPLGFKFFDISNHFF